MPPSPTEDRSTVTQSGQQDNKQSGLPPAMPIQSGENLPLVAKPIPGYLLADPMELSDVSPRPEPLANFKNSLSFGNIASLRLKTTGFENVESGADVLEVDALEELEPQSIAPAVSRLTLPMSILPATGGEVRVERGYSEVAYPAQLFIPASGLAPLRPRLRRGPNPNAPKPVAKQTAPRPKAPSITITPPRQPAQPGIKTQPPQQMPAGKSTPPAPKPKLTIRLAQPPPAAPVMKPPVQTQPAAVRNEDTVSRNPEPATAPPQMPVPTLAVVEDGGLAHFWSNASVSVRLGLAAAVLAVIVGLGYLILSGPKRQVVAAGGAVADKAALAIGGGGWNTTWGAEAPINKGRQISVYRPSANMANYRFEFRGQIDRKAIGWIFRASDPENYYVAKLEVIKPGLNPVIALTRFAVLNGKEGAQTQVPLPAELKLRLDTVYNVRLDVKGNTFTTYLQDKKIDVWTDDRLKAGGVGFYTDRGERAHIKYSQVGHLGSGS